MSGSTSPTAAYVDATGIHAPSYAQVVAYLSGQFQAIFGADIVLTPDSQDGQQIGIFALAISDTNAACIGVYNSFSPATGQGVGLSSNVKINGMRRAVASNSTVPLLLIGQAFTPILNGAAEDDAGNVWNLPASVEIPATGEITVTATAAQAGAITALPGTITRIATVTLGWQSVTNPLAATQGNPVETDAQLRVRQSQSTAQPSETILGGIVGAVLALPGVTACVPYENDTSTDYTTTTPPAGVSPLPPHSISLVVNGGDPVAICQTILLHKTPGCYTYGTTRNVVNDVYGLPHDIGFFIPTPVPVGVNIALNAGVGYSTIIGAAISAAVAAYINALGSGDDVVWSKLWLPANLCDALGVPTGATGTYDITALTVGTPVDHTGASYAMANIPISLLQEATCQAGDVIITATGLTEAPLNSGPPVIDGFNVVGATLTFVTGLWSGTAPITFAFQWTRNGSPIAGATSGTYVIQQADAGATLGCTVTASNRFGSTLATATNTVAVPLSPPVNTTPPIATLNPTYVLCAGGQWAPMGWGNMTYAWFANGVPVSPPGGSTWNFAGYEGQTVHCAVTVSNAAGTSAPTNTNSVVIPT